MTFEERIEKIVKDAEERVKIGCELYVHIEENPETGEIKTCMNGSGLTLSIAAMNIIHTLMYHAGSSFDETLEHLKKLELEKYPNPSEYFEKIEERNILLN